VRDVRADVHVGVQALDVRSRALGLRRPDVGVRVDYLALEVRALDVVVVDDAQRSHARRGEVLDDWRAEAARPDHQHVGVQQALLALRPHVVHDDVTRVAVELHRVEIQPDILRGWRERG